MPKPFIIDMRHNSSDEPSFAVAMTLDQAVEITHKFFVDYEFELRDGRLFDPAQETDQEGFEVFDEVKMHKGKVLEFTHYEGEGPVCRVVEAKWAKGAEPKDSRVGKAANILLEGLRYHEHDGHDIPKAIARDALVALGVPKKNQPGY